jgi:hypothetical protein
MPPDQLASEAILEMAAEPEYNGRRNLRGLAHLPLVLG